MWDKILIILVSIDVILIVIWVILLLIKVGWWFEDRFDDKLFKRMESWYDKR